MTTPIERAALVLERGGLVAFPTDTLYGLAARLDRPDAIARVFHAKGRPRSQPLTVAVASVDAVAEVAVLTPLARRLLPLLPGPLTLVLDRRPRVPDAVTAGGPTVGVRVPAHPDALELLSRAGPLTATSANLHGAPDPPTVEHARHQLGDRVDYYLRSTTAPRGVASTLVDARGDQPRILRKGALDDGTIRQCLAD